MRTLPIWNDTIVSCPLLTCYSRLPQRSQTWQIQSGLLVSSQVMITVTKFYRWDTVVGGCSWPRFHLRRCYRREFEIDSRASRHSILHCLLEGRLEVCHWRRWQQRRHLVNYGRGTAQVQSQRQDSVPVIQPGVAKSCELLGHRFRSLAGWPG